jgi:hypothetical protein
MPSPVVPVNQEVRDVTNPTNAKTQDDAFSFFLERKALSLTLTDNVVQGMRSRNPLGTCYLDSGLESQSEEPEE